MFNQMVEPAAQQLFITDDLTSHSGNTKRYDEVDTQTYASNKNEGSDASKAAVGVGYNITMTAVRRAKEIDITWEMRRYNKRPDVVNALTSLNHFCPQRMDLDLSHVLTFATSTAYTDMDGISTSVAVGDTQALCVSAHTLPFSSTTYRNRLSGDAVFSQGALDSILSLSVSDTYSLFGEKRVMNYNTIITTDDPGTIRDVRQVLESTADVDAAHSGVLNTFRGRFRHVILPNLATSATGARDATKRQWWFLAATGQGLSGWQAYFGIFEATNLKTPSAGNNGEDIHNDNWTFGTRSSYGKAVLSGRGILGSFPTS